MRLILICVFIQGSYSSVLCCFMQAACEVRNAARK